VREASLTAGFKGRVAIGVAWMASARAVVRLLGFISTLVLARLLAPADFGLVAMAMSIAAALELMTSFGFDSALVQERRITRAHYDTAWTLNLSMAVALALVLALTAGFAAAFYREPRLEHLMLFIGIQYVLGSAVNPGTVDFRRDLTFDREFVMQVGPKLAGIMVVLPLAFWLRDYRALIAGMLFASASSCLLSYRMHPHRPRWCVEQARGLFRFSRWLLLNNFVGFLRKRSADFIVGRAFGTAPLGVFSIGAEIAALPSTDMVAPINRVLFPSYVKLADDPERLRAGFQLTLAFIALLVLPVCAGLAAVADPLVRVALGEKWLDVVPLIPPLAIAGAANVLQTNTSAVYNAIGRPRLIALTGGIQAALLIPILIAAAAWFGLVGVAQAFVLHSLLFALPIAYWIFFLNTPIRPRDVWVVSWRPVVACAVMYLVVSQFLQFAGGRHEFLQTLATLVVASLIGALTYTAMILMLWQAAARPAGAESAVLEQAVTRWQRRFRSGTPRV
jgi:lipopolysaccharide exporter